MRPRLQFSSVYAILGFGLPVVWLTRVAVLCHIYVDTAAIGLVACAGHRLRLGLRATVRTLSAIQPSITDRSAVRSAVHSGHARSSTSVRRHLTRLPVVSRSRRSTSARWPTKSTIYWNCDVIVPSTCYALLKRGILQTPCLCVVCALMGSKWLTDRDHSQPPCRRCQPTMVV